MCYWFSSPWLLGFSSPLMQTQMCFSIHTLFNVKYLINLHNSGVILWPQMCFSSLITPHSFGGECVLVPRSF